MKFSSIIKNLWIKRLRSTYFLILILFIGWMVFFDTNSFFIHQELDEDINALEQNKEFYQTEIDNDKAFIKRMDDSNEVEKYAREKYYLKKDNEDIFLIENADSLKINK